MRLSGTLGRLPAMALIGLVRIYQKTLSRLLPPTCRFAPTCSAYMIEAIETHGALRGSAMGIWRVLRCNPFSAGGYDPVPPGPREASCRDCDALPRAEKNRGTDGESLHTRR